MGDTAPGFGSPVREPLAPVTGLEHWTNKGDVRLFLWEKFVGEPTGKRGTIFFVHGSSMASTPTFDLQVPGRPGLSVMDVFARAGYDCWCVDNEGYGRSSKHRDITCDISTGADDLLAAADTSRRRDGPGRCSSTGSRPGR
jgi:pimeloyl-ACP methyl ester carboxylesterase